MLAAGSDEELKALAIKELNGVSDADAQVALGDAWWDWLRRVKVLLRSNFGARARYWYQMAQPS